MDLSPLGSGGPQWSLHRARFSGRRGKWSKAIGSLQPWPLWGPPTCFACMRPHASTPTPCSTQRTDRSLLLPTCGSSHSLAWKVPVTSGLKPSFSGPTSGVRCRLARIAGSAARLRRQSSMASPTSITRASWGTPTSANGSTWAQSHPTATSETITAKSWCPSREIRCRRDRRRSAASSAIIREPAWVDAQHGHGHWRHVQCSPRRFAPAQTCALVHGCHVRPSWIGVLARSDVRHRPDRHGAKGQDLHGRRGTALPRPVRADPPRTRTGFPAIP